MLLTKADAWATLIFLLAAQASTPFTLPPFLNKVSEATLGTLPLTTHYAVRA